MGNDDPHGNVDNRLDNVHDKSSLSAGDTNDYNGTAHRNKRMCMTPLVELDEYIIHGCVPFICEIVEGRSGLR